MDRGFYIAGSAADLRRQLSMDQIANNLANVNTVGFKADRNSFATMLTDSMRAASSAQPPSAYLAPGMSYIDTSEGMIRQTGSPLDFAISGDGYFRVRLKDGSEGYTRAGDFMLGEGGKLVTQSGLPVLDSAGAPITLPSGEVSASRDGTIAVNGTRIATLGIVQISDSSKMRKLGGTLFTAPADQVRPVQPGKVVVRHGALEQSNVNAVLAMARMVDTTRSFQNMMKIVEIYNQQATQLSERVGRVG
ncbi:MAG: flagellar basal-body rod protein FlgF [Zetaproteobacteria bacterium]|nr:MAG: flagellar basal-body rod protein FlgF [Zetaproteobacteria bacterium]